MIHHIERGREATESSPELGGDNPVGHCYIATASNDAGWSSPVARQAHNLKVVGSNPAPATKKPVNSHELAGFPHLSAHRDRTAATCRSPGTGSDARTGIGGWIGYYNADRPHSAFAGRTPDEVYATQENEEKLVA